MSEAVFVKSKSKRDKKLELAAPDPQNLHWANNKSRFGYQMLMKMGWSEGKGLGVNEDGQTEHVKLFKKDDNAGVGADRQTVVRPPSSTQYAEILKRLTEKYATRSAPSVANECSSDEPTAVSAAESSAAEATPAQPVAERSSSFATSSSTKSVTKRKRISSTQSSGDEVVTTVATASVTESTSTISRGGSDNNSSSTTEASRSTETTQSTKQQTVRHKYGKIWRSKSVSNYGTEDLKAIFGVKPTEDGHSKPAPRAADEDGAHASAVPTITSKIDSATYFSQKLKQRQERPQQREAAPDEANTVVPNDESETRKKHKSKKDKKAKRDEQRASD